MNIYVGNLSHTVNEERLRELFQAYGEVTSIKFMTDRETGQPRGFAFVQMPSNDEAQTAMAELNNREVDGKPLRVNEARPQEARSSKGRFGDQRSSRPQGGGWGNRNRSY